MVEYSPARLDATYGALAHPVRREILAGLRESRARVTDLAAPFDISLAAVSKHVAVLEEAALIRRTIVGREHHLSLDAQPLVEASSWLDTYKAFWEGRLESLRELLDEGRGR